MKRELEPYVGPRPFESSLEDQERFFGREREVNEIISLVISHPVTLIYAQSGAGKTSLLNARLIPLLEAKGFEVMPGARMRDPLPRSIAPANIFSFNTLASWKNGEGDLSQLATQSLVEFLKERKHFTNSEGWPLPRIAIFDQFEELFTFHLDHWQHRQNFFEQIRDALEDDHLLRVVFVMREDFIAELDPHASVLPEKLKTRFRLEQLREETALSAVKGPLKNTSLHFAAGVAEQLVRDLLQIPVKTAAGVSEVTGEFVEPVQLQVVCHALWDRLQSTNETEITADHLRAYGDVDQALLNFYERTIREVIQSPEMKGANLKEGALRRWFEQTLITQAGTRGMVFRGPQSTGGLPNVAVDKLESQHIIRAELRGGERWYELSHDRFIEPIKESNRNWLLQYLGAEEMRQRLEEKAALWTDKRRNVSALLDERELPEAERWLETAEAGELGSSEALGAFVQASRMAVDAKEAAHQSQLEQAQALAKAERSRAEAESGRVRQLRWGLVLVSLLLLLMLGLTVFAFQQRSLANNLLFVAQQATADAKKQRNEALRAQAEAEMQKGKAQENYESAQKSLANEKRAKEELEKKNAYAEQQRALAEKQQLIAHHQQQRAESALAETESMRRIAEDSAKKAESEAKKAKSQLLAITASSYLESDPELSVLIASGAIREFTHTRAAEDVLRAGLSSLSSGGRVLHALGNNTMSHYGKVQSVEFSTDGERIMTTGIDMTARLWEARTGRFIAELDSDVKGISYASFSPDGNLIVTTSGDGIARILDGHTGKFIRELTGHIGAVTRAVFSPDGQYVATSSEDKTAIIWNARTGEIIRELLGHMAGVKDLLWSPDGTHLVTEAGDNGRIWDVKTGEFKLLDDLTGEVSAIAFSPDGKMLITERGPGRATVWDTNTGQELVTIGGNKVDSQDQQINRSTITSVAFSEDSRFVIIASSDGDARVWAIQEKEMKVGARLVSELKGHTGSIFRAVFIPNSERVIPGVKLLAATAGGDNTVRIWDAAIGQSLIVLKGHAGGVNSVAFNPQNPSQLITGSDDYTARLWNIEGERLQPELRGHVGGVSSAVFSPDAKSRVVLTTGYDGTVRLWDARTGNSRILRGHSSIVTNAAFSRDGKSLVTSGIDGTAIIWRLNMPGYAPHALKHNRAVYDAEFSPDGERVVTASGDGVARVWDVSTGATVKELKGHKLNVHSASYSPDGRSIVTASGDRTTRIWDSKTFELKRVLVESGVVYSASYSPDSKLIVTASADNTARVWDAETGEILAELKGHTDEVNRAVWSADGRFIATASDDKTARIWEPVMADKSVWRTINILRGHRGKVYSATFSPDTKYIVTASEDGSVRIYPPEMFAVPYDELERLVEERVTRNITKDEWNEILSTLRDQ